MVHFDRLSGFGGGAALLFGLNLVVEGGCFGGGFDAQLGQQQAAAVFILKEGQAVAALAGEETHYLAVGFFAERVEGDLTDGVTMSRLIFAALFVGGGQVVEGGGHLLLEPFALEEEPFLEGVGVGQAETGQQFTLVEVGGGRKPFQAGEAEVKMAVGMEGGFVEQGLEGEKVGREAGAVALNGLAGDGEEGIS
jgi:hypothetical protein